MQRTSLKLKFWLQETGQVDRGKFVAGLYIGQRNPSNIHHPYLIRVNKADQKKQADSRRREANFKPRA